MDKNHNYFSQSSRSKMCRCRNHGKKVKSHTIIETAILPTGYKIVNIMFGEEY
jgi:hypothetical protein